MSGKLSEAAYLGLGGDFGMANIVEFGNRAFSESKKSAFNGECVRGLSYSSSLMSCFCFVLGLLRNVASHC